MPNDQTKNDSVEMETSEFRENLNELKYSIFIMNKFKIHISISTDEWLFPLFTFS